LLPYGLLAACRLDTCESSESTVIRWLPTIAAEPTCTGEQAASTAHAPRPAAPSAATRRPLVLNRALRDTDDPLGFHDNLMILRVGQYRTDNLRAPGQQFRVAQGLTAEAAA
jgi:hypothetical protein